MSGDVLVGSRVLVQFGKRKFFTGIVAEIHDRPQNFEVKPISNVLDSSPVVHSLQLSLWQWISNYYLCSIGDVYKAALPTGLKPESTTQINLNPEVDTNDISSKLTDREAIIVSLLENNKNLSIAEIEKTSGLHNVTSSIRPLMEKGIIEVSEKIVERYRPKLEKMVRLAFKSSSPEDKLEELHEFMSLVARSQRQERTLLAFLDLSQCLARGKEATEVTKKDLIEKSGASPAILKAMIDKGIFEYYTKIINPFKKTYREKASIPMLSNAQQKAHAEIIEAFKSHDTALLHGVTGSGKTEIYSHLINATLTAGYSVLFLVPEISLTTQLTDRLRRIFGDRLLVYHSKFSDYERVEIWNTLLHSEQPLIILGARSAVFLPIRRLGLVIVDEEHESSYKQYDPAPRYNARDTAIMLAAMHGAKTLLGSATPAIDTYYKALNGKYGLVALSERFENATLPDVEIVDMRDQKKRKLASGIFSQPLRLATKSALDAKRQALFFQNRRGFAPFVVCRNCGWTPKCINCDVSLVYHKYSDQLRCHYCGYAIARPTLCPACEENSVEVYGYGTERIAEDTSMAFPEAKVTRMDLDTTRNKDAYQEIIEDFSSKNTDILVGTQMLSKGLDFENVTVVGVLNADSLLNFPDFRCNERAFNMLEQVAGRAGRRSDKGNVFIQTTNPESTVLDHVRLHDYSGFYNEEITNRKKLLYPPFSKIINIYIKNKDPKIADEAAFLFADALRNVFSSRVLGPEKPLISRIATFYLQSIMLKIEVSASMNKVKHILRTLYESLARDHRIKSSIIYYDVDPA